MSRYNHPKTLKIRDYVLRATFIVVAVVVLCLFCPRETTSKLHYAIGEPWDEMALIAKDSFDIYKSEAVLARERDSLRRYYEPYYEIHLQTSPLMVARFKHALDSIGDEFNLSRAEQRQLTYQLQLIYDAGILPDSSFTCLQSNKTAYIHVFSQSESQSVSTDGLRSQQSAYKAMMQQSEEVHSILLRMKVNKYIQPNLTYDAKKSIEQQKEVDKMLTIFSGRVQVGEKIVDKGQIVNQTIYDKLSSFERHEKERHKTPAEEMSKLGGQALYILLIITALFLYFAQFRNDYLGSFRHMLLVTLLLMFFTLLTYEMVKQEWLSVYIIPYCMLPIFIRIFTDSRTAFITHLATVLLCAIALEHPFEFVVLQLMAGLTAIYSLRDMEQRSDLFRAMILVIVASEMMTLCMDLINMNFFNTHGVDGLQYVSVAAGGLLLLLSYLLLMPFEKIFHFTSTVTLVELSNINNEILRRLSEEAPGTFQHSMQVANLSAEVANHLGAKAQLVRTGALYHDIGKLKNPVFFTENQSGTNPHDKLELEDSAQIIIQHVKYGLELAAKYDLPQSIKNFIATHHGRSKTKFFYISYINQHPDKQVNDEIFTYPGPNPTTLEEAILMMADSVEAASRSLAEYTEDSVSNLVDRIIDSQVKEGYFNHCPITFSDIDTAKQVFKEKLKSIYHTRISYPELKK